MKHTLCSSRVFSAFIALTGLAISVRAENLLNNGGFESPGFSVPPYFRYMANGDSTTLTGWTISNDGVGEQPYVAHVAGYPGSIHSGNYAVILNQGAGLQTTFPVVKGVNYEMSVFGSSGEANPGLLPLSVNAAGFSTSFTFGSNFGRQSFVFTATNSDAAAPLLLTNVSPAGDYKIWQLDDVQLARIGADLNFTSLPSAQGWTYSASGNSQPEANIFSVNGGVLTQNSMGVGFAGSGNNSYALMDAVDTNRPFVLTFRARVLQQEQNVAYNTAGFFVSVRTGTELFDIFLSPNDVQGPNLEVLASNVDLTQFHDFRMEGTAGSSLKVFMDGTLLGITQPRAYISPNMLAIGDPTGGANAHAEVTSYSFVQSGTCAAPGSELVSWWPAEGTAKDIWNENHGSLQNGTTFAPGKIGQAFSFDGTDDYVSIPANASLPYGSSPRTIEMWIYTRPGSWADNANTPFEYGIGSTHQAFGLDMNPYPNLQFYTWADDLTFDAGVSLEGWFHFAVTYDGGTTLRAYINGVERASKTLSGPLNTAFSAINIGRSAAINQSFDGLIDEFTIHNRALSGAEIAAIYGADSSGRCLPNQCTPPPSGLTAWWTADDTANDIWSGNDGALKNGATYASGVVGDAFNLDGANDFVQAPDSPSWAFGTGDFSIDLWANFSATSGSRALLSSDIGPGSVNKWIFWLDGGVLKFHINGPANVNIGSATFTPALGQWYHLAVTRTGGDTYTFYIDGTAVSTNINNTAVPDANAPLLIGAAENNFFFGGRIDEVEILNRALTQTEVQRIVYARSSGQCHPTCTSAPSGLISLWKAEGSAIDSVTSSNGVPQNGATFAIGKVGDAFGLDGVNDYVDLGHVALPSTFTIETWVNPASLANSPFICAKDDGGSSRSYFLEVESTGALVGSVYSPGGPLNFTQYRTVPGVVIPGKWQHVAFTYNGSAGADQKMKFYVDGAAVTAAHISTYDNGGTPAIAATTTKLGILANGTTGPFAGRIDELSFYNRVLSASEVGAIYGASSAGKCAAPPSCTPQPGGIVSWWRAENNALDSIGSNNGTLVNGAMYVAGKAGHAFSFDGLDDYVSLNGTFGGGPEVTVESWVKSRGDTGDFQAIVSSAGTAFLHFQMNTSGNVGVYTDAGLILPPVIPPGPAGVYRHLAITVKPGEIRIYENGNLLSVTPANFNYIVPASDIRIGSGYVGGRFFNGDIDEVAIYNRALSASEIQSIFNAGSEGKCIPPIITSQPQSQDVLPGGSAQFSVTATSTIPGLSYQWRLNGTNIAGAISSTFSIVGVTATNAGNYTVVVSNEDTSVTSAVAVLRIISCVEPPTGQIAWWRAENNALDSVSTNHGTLQNGATFAAGRVGQAFSFDGSDDQLYIGDPASLSSLSNAITIEAWIKTTDTDGRIATKLTPIFTPLRGFNLDVISGYLRMEVFDPVGTLVSCGSANPVNNGNWHHVAGTYDRTNMILYVDGILVGSSSGSVVIGAANNNPLTIGSWQGAFPFAGVIDDISIYNRALTATEIQLIYNASVAGKCDSETTLADSTFDDSDWISAIADSHGPTPNFSAGKVATGGNPGSYRQLSHSYGPTGDIVTGHRLTTFTYNPPIDGALTRLHYFFDVYLFNGGASGAVAYFPALYQNGKWYSAGYSLALNPSWEQRSFLDLNALSFTEVGGTNHPNFSAAGAPIQFGYTASNGTSLGNPTTTLSGLDNFKVIVESGSTLVDTNPPTIAVLSPKASPPYTTLTPALTINGTAKDNFRVVAVEYDLNNAGYTTATLSSAGSVSNWTANIQMIPGTNAVLVRARDLVGNYSKTNKVVFFWHVPTTLTLVTNGVGQITGVPNGTLGTPTNNALLFVGRGYKLVVQSALTNSVLTNITYTAAGGESGELFVNTAGLSQYTLWFTMKSNMTITAKFISNPLVRYGGVYNGLFHEADLVRHHSAGYVTLKVTPKFAVSGKLYLDGNIVGFSGKMSLNGTMSKVVSRVKFQKSDLNLTLAMNLSGTETLSGTVAGTNWTAALLADRVTWTTNLGEQALQFTNAYTMLMPGFATNSDGPVGFSSATASVNPLGKIKLSGALSDGVVAKQSTIVSRNGNWPLFSSIYPIMRTNAVTGKSFKEYYGEVLGWLTFTNNDAAGTTNYAPLGTVDWIKTGWTNASWTGGFTNQFDVTSSRHMPPTNVATRIYSFTNALVRFAEGNLFAGITNSVLLQTNNAFIVSKPVTNNFKGGLTAKTGLIKGTFAHPDDTNVVTKWTGVMLQDYNYGRGYFVSPATTNASGNVFIEPY